MTTHERYMQRALQLSAIGLPHAMPNPSVGAVLVCKDTIIGEGFTSAYGGNHAEVNAILSVKEKQLLEESTLYVTLEPCNHFGKTPPCSHLIVDSKIKKVVVGCTDPFKEVAGKGIEYLKKKGVEVIVGILENECKESHKRFFSQYVQNIPYIILKWAETADGFIAPEKQESIHPVWISNPYSLQLTHKWRSQEAAILVGTQTVLKDNPSLTTRNWCGKNPVRLYIDFLHKVNSNFEITNGSVKTICITDSLPNRPISNVIYELVNKKQLPREIARVCIKHQLQSIIIEGGANLLQQFIDEGLWHEVRVFSNKNHWGKGIKAPKITNFIEKKHQIITDNQLKIFYPNL